MEENSHLDKKSLAMISGKNANWKELSKDCVCFSNGVGGKILIGIEDEDALPPAGQKIEDSIIEKISKNISSNTLNVSIFPLKRTAENGGEYIEINVSRTSSIASTTDGKYYIRVADECKPLLPDELGRLLSDKNAFVWETLKQKTISYKNCDAKKLSNFVADIKGSERVSQFVKDKLDEEIAEHYFLSKDGVLTNLGVLWIGQRNDRATIHYAPSVQFIKYNEKDQKVLKKVWDDFSQNPKEMMEEILYQIPDWQEAVEVSDGIFRKKIYDYPLEVIRELVANAFAHRNYTMRGDVFINLYHDRLEIHSPGLLPLGVTPANILTKSVPRNALICKLFYDLKLMEKEGSGYDKIYELLLLNGKTIPDVFEGDDRVVVTIKKNIISKDVLQLMDKVEKELHPKQRELIALGIIANHEGISALELGQILNCSTKPNGIQFWLGPLLDTKIVLTKGRTKGQFYYINPSFLKTTDYIEKTNLKRIEPHRLQELIYQVLSDHPQSSISDIHKRIGEDVKQRTLKSKIDEMIESNTIIKEGVNKGTKYYINKTK